MEIQTMKLFLLFFLASSLWGDIRGYVVKVQDGDTLTILEEKVQHKIRLISIDSPERKQPFYRKAKQALAAICFNKNAIVKTRKKD